LSGDEETLYGGFDDGVMALNQGYVAALQSFVAVFHDRYLGAPLDLAPLSVRRPGFLVGWRGGPLPGPGGLSRRRGGPPGRGGVLGQAGPA
jgi:hypothetical protein